MALVEDFGDLIAWQRAREVHVDAQRLAWGERFIQRWALRDQMRRAALSVMANIAGGFERGSRKEFRQFLVIARASCGEVRSDLTAALDAGCIDASDFTRLRDLCFETSRIIGGLRASLDRPRDV